MSKTLSLFGDEYSDATFSSCRKYRYDLIRTWDPNKKTVSFVCLNPSTADERENDPTVRRCITYAKDWGFGTFHMLNLFAFRATERKDMKAYPEPIGSENDKYILNIANESSLIICAWGADGNHLSRDKEVVRILHKFDLKCLAVTKDGHPGHPLYLKKDLVPIPYG